MSVGAAILLLLIAVLAIGYLLLRADRQPKIRHPTIRSKSTARSFQETNSAARLLAGVTQLRKDDSPWPIILRTLNSDDNPQVRTVLLELRALRVSDPQSVLVAIEEACLASYRESSALSRVDIMDRAKTRLREVGELSAKRS